MQTGFPKQRILLTYQDAKYTRLIIYVGLFLLSYGYIRFFPSDSGDTTVFQKIALVIIFFSFFLSIFEGLFILTSRYIYKRVEFDEHGLYITAKGKAEIDVPLGNISKIEMMSSGRGARGNFTGYEITYTDDYSKSSTAFITVYWRKWPLFDEFVRLVKQQNAGVEVKKYMSSIDGIIKLFKRKKQVS